MSILDTIVEDTRGVIAERKSVCSAARLRNLPLYDGPRRDFAAALRLAEVAIIAELKQHSPSRGSIRSDFDVAALASGYSEAGAAAISVLTEPHHFKGSLDFLSKARAHSSVPVLRKDFIIDPYQIIEARAYGADAVLLIATILDRVRLSELLVVCRDEGIAALVEVYDEDELNRIDYNLATVVGANNRDLHTFEVDIGRSARILDKVPDNVVTVAESGLASPDDIAFLMNLGVDAFLVGERFMIEPDPGHCLARWLDELKSAETET